MLGRRISISPLLGDGSGMLESDGSFGIMIVAVRLADRIGSLRSMGCATRIQNSGARAHISTPRLILARHRGAGTTLCIGACSLHEGHLTKLRYCNCGRRSVGLIVNEFVDNDNVIYLLIDCFE